MRKEFRHGLVIGKFYPPHAGHEYLIRSASDWCEIVTVVVMASSVESIALSLRVEWLREICANSNVTIVGVMDDDPIDFESEAVWSAHIAHMQRGVSDANALRATASMPDVVFTSEGYGAELSRRFSAAHVCLDQSRALYPVSGTLVRSTPVQHWNHLAPCVRAHLCRRIVIVGAESTGKTTLAAALAEALRDRGGLWARTQWVPEYGREYTINKLAVSRALDTSEPHPGIEELKWESSEFDHIATTQLHWEQQAARSSSPLLVCDTDSFATGIWHERYLRSASNEVQSIAQRAVPRLGYILTSWRDVDFHQDGIRDGEHIREWMHDQFASRIPTVGTPWMLASGSAEQRLEAALEWIDKLLPTAWQFADPLG